MRPGDAADRAPQREQVMLGGAWVVVHRGLYFHLGLQHLAAEAFAQRGAACIEETTRHVPQAPPIAPHEEILLFQAEGIGMRAGFRCHARVIAPGR